MNVHYYAGKHITTEDAKRRGLVTKGQTQPARTRDGKIYPGGRELRRRLARLAARKNARPVPKELPQSAYQMPGSMN